MQSEENDLFLLAKRCSNSAPTTLQQRMMAEPEDAQQTIIERTIQSLPDDVLKLIFSMLPSCMRRIVYNVHSRWKSLFDRVPTLQASMMLSAREGIFSIMLYYQSIGAANYADVYIAAGEGGDEECFRMARAWYRNTMDSVRPSCHPDERFGYSVTMCNECHSQIGRASCRERV